jgi:hypothetical protein
VNYPERVRCPRLAPPAACAGDATQSISVRTLAPTRSDMWCSLYVILAPSRVEISAGIRTSRNGIAARDVRAAGRLVWGTGLARQWSQARAAPQCPVYLALPAEPQKKSLAGRNTAGGRLARAAALRCPPPVRPFGGVMAALLSAQREPAMHQLKGLRWRGASGQCADPRQSPAVRAADARPAGGRGNSLSRATALLPLALYTRPGGDSVSALAPSGAGLQSPLAGDGGFRRVRSARAAARGQEFRKGLGRREWPTLRRGYSVIN